MRATKIKMKPGCYYSQSVLEIDEIYIEDCATPGFYKKASVYDYLIEHPKSIYVDIWPYPYLIPQISKNREKYVRSTPDPYSHDDLLDLPRK